MNTNLVQFERKATVCKYIVPQGYPEKKDQKGQVVEFPSVGPKARIYFGDVSEAPDDTLQLGFSRAAGIVGIGETIAEAEGIAQELCEKVKGPVRCRRDIGTAERIGERVRMMRGVRAA